MNRYDHHFRMLPLSMQTNGLQRVEYAHGAIFQHRANGFGPDDDEAIVRQFDLSGMTEYWDLQLSEPMRCFDFARVLAVHFFVIILDSNSTAEDVKASGPAASKVEQIKRVGVMAALRAARADEEPWFMTIPAPQPSSKLDTKAWFAALPSDVVIVRPDPPSDGIDLSKLKVKPRAAAEWLLAMPKRRHLVPPSLVGCLRGVDVSVTDTPPKTRRGRKPGTGYQKSDEPIARRMIAMNDSGEAQSLSEAARMLIGRDGKGAKGIGEPGAKVERLVGVANHIRDAERKRE